VYPINPTQANMMFIGSIQYGLYLKNMHIQTKPICMFMIGLGNKLVHSKQNQSDPQTPLLEKQNLDDLSKTLC
jgi:hypothetical protein